MKPPLPESSILPKRTACLLTLLCALVSTTTLAAPDGTLDVLRVPRKAPEFVLPGIDGGEHRLGDFRGRYLLVNFWAVWCQPCRKEMPSMERVYAELKNDGFEILAIHVGPSLEGAKQAAGELGVTFPVVVDENMALTAWRVRGLPTSYLLDPEGKIVAQAVGERAWDSPAMLEALRGFLKQGEQTEPRPIPVSVSAYRQRYPKQ